MPRPAYKPSPSWYFTCMFCGAAVPKQGTLRHIKPAVPGEQSECQLIQAKNRELVQREQVQG